MRQLKRSECAVLPLVLNGKWYDMIERGEKTEEYRDATPYWAIRLCTWDNAWGKCVVEFRRGYGRDAPRMAFECDWVFHVCRSRHPEWGEPDRPHYLLALGERVGLAEDGGGKGAGGDRRGKTGRRRTETPRQNPDGKDGGK